MVSILRVTCLRAAAAGRAAFFHLVTCVAVAGFAAVLVFQVWYPHPYRDLSGGRELFLLVIGVDIVCGPLLTLVLFNPRKPKVELWRDMALVIAIQLSALGYGVHSVWQAKPLYLVLELDRFKVVTRLVLDETTLVALPAELRPRLWHGPKIIGVRDPRDETEREKVALESVQGGRDYAERPEFYVPYSDTAAAKALVKARPLSVFLQKQPSQLAAANELAASKKADIAQFMYLPVVARQDWVAVLDKQGQIQGFLKGDGF